MISFNLKLYGEARRGTARHGEARRGTARHGEAQRGTAWETQDFAPLQRRRLLPFRKLSFPFLTVDVIISNQAFSHGLGLGVRGKGLGVRG